MTDDTLQTDADEAPELESAPVEIEGDEPTETDAAAAAETKEETPGERYNKRINDKHRQMMEQTRRADDLEQQLAETRAKLPQEQRPSVPELPDPYDADFGPKMAARDTALRETAAYDARQTLAAEQQQTKAQEAQREQQAALVTRVTTYTERAQKHGINAEQLQVAGQTVAQYGISDELTNFILDDEQGPQITAYLSKNPGELDELSRLTPVQAAVRIATVVKPKASQHSGLSGAPEPVTGLSGGGAPPAQRGPAGATYE